MKRLSTRLLFCLLPVLATSSCDTGNGTDSTLHEAYAGTAVTGHRAGDYDIVSCSFSGEWLLAEGCGGFDISPVSGTAGTADITVTATEDNPRLSEREATAVFTDKGHEYALHIIQRGSPGLILPATEFNISDKGGDMDITVDGNVDFEVSSDADWAEPVSTTASEPVTLSDSRTLSDSLRYTVTVSIAPNDSGTERTATLTLSSQAGEYEVTVVQTAPLKVEWDRAFFRRTAVLRFTATWCYKCPVMANALNEACEQMPDRIVQMNMHGRSSEGGLAYYYSPDYEDLYSVSGYPTGIANNLVRISNDLTGDLTGTFMAVAQEATELFPANTGITASMRIADDALVIDAGIAVKTPDDYTICIFLVESGISYPQEGVGYDYTHNFVVRDVLTGDILGDPLPAAGAEEVIDYSIEADLPRSVLVPENLSAVIAIGRPGTFRGECASSLVQYMDTGMMYDNCVIVPAGGSVQLRYEDIGQH